MTKSCTGNDVYCTLYPLEDRLRYVTLLQIAGALQQMAISVNTSGRGKGVHLWPKMEITQVAASSRSDSIACHITTHTIFLKSSWTMMLMYSPAFSMIMILLFSKIIESRGMYDKREANLNCPIWNLIIAWRGKSDKVFLHGFLQKHAMHCHFLFMCRQYV